MKILSIETSCDETAASVVEAKGDLTEPFFNVLGNALFSQIEIHKKYGGVFPAMAKREHAKNLPRLLVEALREAKLYSKNNNRDDRHLDEEKCGVIKKILEREEGLFEDLKNISGEIEKPDVDFIAVTSGPGLEPALWVGISFALALGALWDIPVLPVNHMEGHIASVLLKTDEFKIDFPAVALLISGGHTELVEILNWGEYKIMGQTKDDAVGEAFDKVARMLSLPYPGGPQISAMAEMARVKNLPRKAKLPRPMMHSGNLDFSFSGLKTSVLYYIRDHGDLSDTDKEDLAREFEDAVTDVLLNKTKRAVEETGAKTLIVAGGVIANKKLKESFHELENVYTGLKVFTPTKNMSTDNSVMIALAGYINVSQKPELLKEKNKISANGNLSLS